MNADKHTTASSTHERIVDAATHILFRDGYNASMDVIAHAAGVSKQTVYAHFASKNMLFEAVVRHLYKPVYSALADEELALTPLLLTLAATCQQRPVPDLDTNLGRALISEPPRTLPLVRELIHQQFDDAAEKLAVRLSVAMARGQMRRSESLVAARLFFSLLGGLRGDAIAYRNAVGFYANAFAIEDGATRYIRLAMSFEP